MRNPATPGEAGLFFVLLSCYGTLLPNWNCHPMAWQEPSERHNDAVVAAIGHAAHTIATAITQGFAHMADVEAQALADLAAAVTQIGTAITAEIAALQTALAGTTPPVDHSPAIEAAVTNLNTLAASLTASLPPATTPAAPAAPKAP